MENNPRSYAAVPKPIFTGLHRCLWIEQITFDNEIAPLHHRVGCAIVAYVNRFSGVTFVGRDTLASRLAVSTKSVDRAVAVLEKAGHLAVEHARGRGHSNRYRPVLRTQSATKDGDHDGSSRELNGTNQNRKGDISGSKTGQPSPPNHDTLTKSYNHESTDESPGRTNARSAGSSIAKADIGSKAVSSKIHGALIGQFDGDGFDGEEVFLNLDEELYAVCCNRQSAGRLTADDVSLARSRLLAEKQKGFAIEPFPKAR